MLTLLLSALLTFVELNCENLFDTRHDSLKQDLEYTPESDHHWTRTRYWRKLNHISKEIIAMGEDSVNGWQLPDLVALCEVENDSVMHDLTRRSLLRGAGYQYVMTNSPDVRGLDVALLYNPFTFRLLRHYGLRISPVKGMRPTRDILYACGMTLNGDTLHIFALHAPSRLGGERPTRPHRMAVAKRLVMAIDSIKALHAEPCVILAGDFNDYDDGPTLEYLCANGLVNISAKARGSNGAKGTYRYRGEWRSLDHILCSPALARRVRECFIGDKYQPGYSDHLPLVARFE